MSLSEDRDAVRREIDSTAKKTHAINWTESNARCNGPLPYCYQENDVDYYLGDLGLHMPFAVVQDDIHREFGVDLILQRHF
jgi:hypothetical protein